MAQIARKLPSMAKPRMVNCDLGHSWFMAEGRIKFFVAVAKKYVFAGRAASGKYVLSGRSTKNVYNTTYVQKNKEWPKSHVNYLPRRCRGW